MNHRRNQTAAALSRRAFIKGAAAAEHGITANAIAPGPIDTEIFHGLPEERRERRRAELPTGRAGRVEENVPTVLLLVSDEGVCCFRATLNADRGDVMV
jgi:3-oxoacyl-[acyl-carrier protein] reductase